MLLEFCHVDGVLIGVIALNLLWFCGFGLLLVGGLCRFCCFETIAAVCGV